MAGTDGHGVRPLHCILFTLFNFGLCSNKWVLNATEAPLFFLWAQLVIAVMLFLACNALNLVKIPLEVNMELVRGLTPMVGLSVVGLRCAISSLS